MSQVTITLPDGSSRAVSAGTSVREVAAQISPGLAKAAYAGVVDGKLVDLSYALQKDSAVRIVTDKSPEVVPLLRHSTAHLMAAAVTNLFPGAQCGIGPATDEGFFYDFIVDRPFVPEDLDRIEAKMRELAQQDLPYERQMWPREEAKTFFRQPRRAAEGAADRREDEGQTEVSCYTIKDKETFVDFCVGPHVPSTSKLKAFKLLSTSNAYWKGDARNAPMQRIYGTAFASDKELKAYLTQIEEAKKRDHRKLGRELGLFTFHPWAPGAAFWLDKGNDAVQHARKLHARRALPCRLRRGEDASRLQQGVVGAVGSLGSLPGEHVPHRVGRRADEPEADELSGTFPDLRQHDAQLPRPSRALSRADAAASQRSVGRARRVDARAAVLAGRCALLHHTRANRRRGRAASFGSCNASTATSACRSRRSSRRAPRNFSARWRRGITRVAAQDALARANLEHTINEGDGAFYGPKIDFDVTDAIGRKWQCATIQLDYQQPENFDLKYIGADNAEHRPVVIHRAIFGSFERFIAILIEHYAGAFPLWLAPVQAVVLPISDRHQQYAASVRDKLAAAGLRVELDDRQEKIGYKIREAQLQKIPYMLVTGDREATEGTVSVRSRSGGDLGARGIDAFVEAARDEIAAKRGSELKAQGSSNEAVA
jgi:threonyl-tRNA synthetase